MPQASELIVQFLHEAGVAAVFGIPGGGPIFTHLAGPVAGYSAAAAVRAAMAASSRRDATQRRDLL